MANRQKVDKNLRVTVVKLHKQNVSIREIAERVNRSKSVIGRIVKTYKDTGRVLSQNKMGRPRKTSARQDRAIQRIALRDRFTTAAQISRDLQGANTLDVSRCTVSRRLQEIGLLARRPRKKPLISRKNKLARLQFANKHVNWSQEQWSKVFFSDESKFNLFGNDGKNYVRRYKGEEFNPKCTKKTVKFGGGSVMVFGMFSIHGTYPLVRLNTRVNAAIYKNLLVDHVIPNISNSGINDAIFMQDNAPCHKAKSVMSYLQQQEFEIMDWPAQSPDLNPIENLWKTLGEKVMAQNPANTDDLWVKLQNEWTKISVGECRKLIQSCSSRCAAVVKNKGLFTKY